MFPSKNSQLNALHYIDQLDLSEIKQSFVKKGWNLEQCEFAELWYRRFLIIKVKYPDQSIVPHGVVDEIWHAHILDTKKYAKDCNEIFGFFLHHTPTYGKKNLSTSLQDMEKLYFIEFGEKLNNFRLQTDVVLLEGPDCDASSCMEGPPEQN